LSPISKFLQTGSPTLDAFTFTCMVDSHIIHARYNPALCYWPRFFNTHSLQSDIGKSAREGITHNSNQTTLCTWFHNHTT